MSIDFQNSFTVRLSSKWLECRHGDEIITEDFTTIQTHRYTTFERQMSGNYRRYETNVLFNNKFKLNLLQ